MLKLCPDDYQLHLFHDGSYFKSYEMFGAKLLSKDGIHGVSFTVWAPHAKEVQVVGNFNLWDGNSHAMEKINNEGVWNVFIPDLQEGERYKYKIITKDSKEILKADPYGYYSEIRPHTASIVYSLEEYKWKDRKWVREQAKKNHFKEPLYIYELHIGSWKKKGSNILASIEPPVESFYTYKEITDELIPYVKEHKFTHIELMPLVEHPYDPSWGYQGTGYYAVTSRYGTPKDFMYFIDQCHQNGIGVIMDWVPGHFCKDSHGLYMFDGTPTYEYENISVRENPVWGTANFDIGKKEVQSYLISNALFWLEYFHIDGFRVDAVANMLYWELDGKWQKNEMAVQFLQKLNETISTHYPHAIICAEDSTDWPLVTSPPSDGGLGFHYKWNMGWMNDMLTYMECHPYERKHIHHKVTFSMLYAFSENFILPLSHDEVVHGKKSLLNKMPGDYWQKFAQLRLLYGYMFTHPGKKLLFMGGEFGQFDEWKDKEQLDWMLFDFEMHQKMNDYTKDLFSLYKRSKSLWQLDHTYEGFQWIDADNSEQSIFSFIRKGEQDDDFLVIVCNFTPETYQQYKVGVPKNEYYSEVFNSDDMKYGGSGQINKKKIKGVHAFFHNQPYYVEITIPPLGIMILRPVKRRKGSKKDEEMRSNVIGRRTGKSTKGADKKLS